MKKITLTTYYSPDEAHAMLVFLDELRDGLLLHYGDDIAKCHRQRVSQEEAENDWPFEDDVIPF